MDKSKIIRISAIVIVLIALLLLLIWGVVQVIHLFREKVVTGPKYPKQSEFDIRLSNQNNQMQVCEMMETLANLLDKYSIDYWIIGGTCLGAIRHKGMIPWDDDIDIAIMKDQENVLKSEVFRRELDNMGFRLPSYSMFGYKLAPKNSPPIDSPPIDAMKAFNPKYYPFIDIFIMKKGPDRRILFDRKFAQVIWSKEWFYEYEVFPTEKIDFGSFKFRAPRSPHAYLARTFGRDYNTKGCYAGRHGQIWYPKKCFPLNSSQKRVCGCKRPSLT